MNSSYCIKLSKIKRLALLFIIQQFSVGLFAQSPYTINWKNELPYLAFGVGTSGIGAYLRTLPAPFSPDELLTQEVDDVNALDRIATSNYSIQADHLSDYFWLGSHFTPALLLIGENSRQHFGQIMTLYSEVATINLGITIIIKSLAKRPRPFVFNSEVLQATKLTRNAKTSFLSGHTSFAAVNSFFAAKVYADFYPESKWKPVVWSAAAVIPAITAYLRVEAGRHYPTDVIAGYALGGTLGILIPHLHRNKLMGDKGLSLSYGLNQVTFRWQFKH